ncbi:MAG TPA: hypothetical protein PKC29_12785 [Thermodesulfobacteriota bacterium]|nr:hypothetical protein [Thermodesulfobacteriota bacterium]
MSDIMTSDETRTMTDDARVANVSDDFMTAPPGMGKILRGTFS